LELYVDLKLHRKGKKHKRRRSWFENHYIPTKE
jgi:hypothetical protein